MDWIILKISDLEYALNKLQLDILKAQQLRSPDTDVAAEAIANVVVRIRAEIAAGGANWLDTDHARIPPELKEPALRLAVEVLQVRIPSMELSESQTKHADLAREILARVARGELPVSRPMFAVSAGDNRKGIAAKSAPRTAAYKTLGGI